MGKGRTSTVETAKNKARFLAEYRVCLSVEKTATKTGISRWTHRTWLDVDPKYREKYLAMKDCRNEHVEDFVYGVATGETKDVKMPQLVAAMFWLKNNCRGTYGENSRQRDDGGRRTERVVKETVIKDYTQGTLTTSKEVKVLTEGEPEEIGEAIQDGTLNASRVIGTAV